MIGGAVRTSLLLPLSCLLSGCWVGQRFYQASEVRAPVAPGRYRVVHPDPSEEATGLRVTIRADGLTWMQPSDSGPGAVGFAPLPGRPGYFIAWDALTTEDRDESSGVAYALFEVRAGDYRYAMPTCPATRGVAEGAGAVFSDDPKLPTCTFHDRDSLEAALRQVISDPGLEWVRLVPARNGR